MALAVMLVLAILKPLLIVFMLSGLMISYVIHHAIKHPAWRQLLAQVAAECVGLLLMLALFVSLMVLYGQLLAT